MYDLVRPVNPLRVSHDAGEDEGEALALRALDEGRAVVASGSRFPDTSARADEALMNDALVTWKSILLGAIFEVSDDDLEFLVLDRLSFRRFTGLSMTERPPRAGMLKVNREHWSRTGVMAELVADVDRRWRNEGYRLPGLERLTGSSPAYSGSPEDGGLDQAGTRPGPRAMSGLSRGSKRRGRRKRKNKRRRKRR